MHAVRHPASPQVRISGNDTELTTDSVSWGLLKFDGQSSNQMSDVQLDMTVRISKRRQVIVPLAPLWIVNRFCCKRFGRDLRRRRLC
jgi:hypothetical protein